jgi:hypothetical protein
VPELLEDDPLEELELPEELLDELELDDEPLDELELDDELLDELELDDELLDELELEDEPLDELELDDELLDEDPPLLDELVDAELDSAAGVSSVAEVSLLEPHAERNVRHTGTMKP